MIAQLKITSDIRPRTQLWILKKPQKIFEEEEAAAANDHNLYSMAVAPTIILQSIWLIVCYNNISYNIQNQAILCFASALYQHMHNQQRNDDENKDIEFSFFPILLLLLVL